MKRALLIAVGLAFGFSVFAQGTGRIGISVPGVDFKNSYALLVGVSDYNNGWHKLPGVKEDVAAVKDMLQRHGFTVISVMNPDHKGLKSAFENFKEQYGLDRNTRLLFYFAGHGHTETTIANEKKGYLVPVDAPLPNRDIKQFKSRAMSMDQIETYAREMEALQVLFMFDACFAGTIFTITRAMPQNISYKLSQPVRQFITSGNENEEVPDQSIFRRQFISALSGEGDINGDGFVTGTELGEFLQEKVINYSNGGLHPQYGKIKHPNLDKGDFVFVLSAAAAAKTVETQTVVVSENMRSFSGYQKQGDAAFAKGDYAGAKKNYETALKYYPEDANCRDRLERIEAIEAETAIKSFRSAFSGAPDWNLVDNMIASGKAALWWKHLDPVWKKALRSASGIGTQPTPQDFSRLFRTDSLDLAAAGLRDLEPLIFFPRLRRLDLSENEIENIAQLGSLKSLAALGISDNYIADVSPLSLLHNLVLLDISFNVVENLRPLFSLEKLQALDCSGNYITSLEGISALSGLRKLVCYENEISDITPLRMANNITHLYLSANNLTDISALVNLNRLEVLHCDNNQLKSLPLFGAMPNLEELNIASNEISDLSPLRQLTRLKTLIFYSNRVTDVKPLAQLSGLKKVDGRLNYFESKEAEKLKKQWENCDFQY